MATHGLKAKRNKINYGAVSMLCLATAITSTTFTAYSAVSNPVTSNDMDNVYDKLQDMLDKNENVTREPVSGGTVVDFSNNDFIERSEVDLPINQETGNKEVTFDSSSTPINIDNSAFDGINWPGGVQIEQNTSKPVTKPTAPVNKPTANNGTQQINKPVTKPITKPVAKPNTNNTSTVDKFKDPFEVDPFGSQTQTMKPNISNNNKPVTNPTPNKPTETKPSQNNTTNSTSNEEYLVVEKPGLTFDEAARQLGLQNINSQFKLNGIEDIKPSDKFLAQSLTISKKDVQATFNNLTDSSISKAYNLRYDSTNNIIYVENKDISILKTGSNLSNIFRLNDKSTVLLINAPNTAFTLERVDTDSDFKTVGTYILAKDGFNGYAELMVGNIPVIFYNNVSIEPLLPENTLAEIQALMQPTIDKIPNPDYVENNQDIQDDYDYENNGYDVNTDYNDDYSYEDNGVYEDSGLLPGVDTSIDYNEQDDFWGDDIVTDTTLPDLESELGDLSGILGIPTVNPNKYTPVWGTTETADHLKENVKDGQDILERIYQKPSLNVVDIQGETIDLEKKTSETKPAELKRQKPIAISKPMEKKDIRPILFTGGLISLISLIGFFISTHLYYKEGMRNASLKVLEEDTTSIEATNFDEMIDNDEFGNAKALVESALQ